MKPSPVGAACHPGRPEYNNATCASILQEWFSIDNYADFPMDNAWSNWNNDSCLPWTTAPCTNDAYPVYVVNATCKEDVKKGVDFARKHDVRLVVKSTGHDYLGRSIAPNSLSIWTHNMKGISFSKGFKPRGCQYSIDTDAITFRAGNVMAELNAAAALKNLTIISGGEESVGYGGYMTGGGHGALGATYGMAADLVLELEIVTPGGDIVIANECQNQDLFWATRGGGGSTFGVITSTTLKAFPSAPFIMLTVSIGTAPNSEEFWDFATYFLSQFPALSDAGIAGYGTLAASATIGNTTYGGYSGLIFIPGVSISNTSGSLAAAFAPIIEHVNTTWPGKFQYSVTPKTFSSFYEFWLFTEGPQYAGIDMMVGSRLLDAKALSGDLPALKKALQIAMGAGALNPYLLGGKGVRDVVPRGGSDAVNPAWRTSLVHCTLGVTWGYFNQTQKAEQEDLLTNTYVKALRDLAPDTGAYVNEADANEPNFQQTFWGDNYPRLLEIKRRVDPQDVFWCTPCVGNERWKEVGNNLCKV